MLSQIKSISVELAQKLRQNTIMYPALLATATGILLANGTGLNLIEISVISAVSMGAFHLSAKATQFTMALANELYITVQNVRATSENINKLTQETQKLVTKLNDETTPELMNKVEEITDTLQNAIEDVTDVAQTFKGGLQLNFGQGNAPSFPQQPAQTPQQEISRRNRRNRHSPTVLSVEMPSSEQQDIPEKTTFGPHS